jgi:hypothetical protein
MTDSSAAPDLDQESDQDQDQESGQDQAQEPAPPTPKSPDRVAKRPKHAARAKRQRSISTPALYSLLLVLGLICGAGAGYAVQAARKPTPLPSLAVAQPAYPRSAPFTGRQPTTLPGADDDATITNGNLTALLLPTPGGATAIPGLDHTWQTLADTAANCADQVACFNQELTDGVARIAEAGWTLSDGTFETITITQYSPGSSSNARQDFSTDTAGDPTATTPLPGLTGTDTAGYSYTATDDQGNTEYADYMAALHGTLLVEFQVWSNAATPPSSVIYSLITQQLARL